MRWGKAVLILNAAISALLQVLVIGGLPFLAYWIYLHYRHKRTLREVARRAGLQMGDPRYVAYSFVGALATAGILVIWSPPLEPLTRPGSAQHQFVGLGFSLPAVGLAFFYGVLQTSFAEELLFRGLIAGSLSRQLPLVWADVVQALIFVAPHVAILRVAPELWGILPVVFAAAMLLGWLRIKSGSILGPWLIHATGNVTIALIVATRTHA